MRGGVVQEQLPPGIKATLPVPLQSLSMQFVFRQGES